MTKFLWLLWMTLFFIDMTAHATPDFSDVYAHRRQLMIATQIERRGVKDPAVLDAIRKVERHLFVPLSFRESAYEDHPLEIGHDQTISQPYIVAFMTEAAGLKPTDKVLEIGTGSGYQAAVLAEVAGEVYTIEILKPLADQARKRLEHLGYKNVHVKHGDGFLGWPEAGPFDAILVTAAPDELPEMLVAQLKVGGRMIVPVGSIYQNLELITKTEKGHERKELFPVRFVPMVRGEDKHPEPGD